MWSVIQPTWGFRDWAVDYWEALHPYSEGGAYVNFMMNEGQERAQATYRDNRNLFQLNQNIRPAL